jgi:ATP-binding cassette subfamily F protein uup
MREDASHKVKQDSKAAVSTTNETRRNRNEEKRRLTYKEKMEFQQLEQDIETLEAEKASIEAALSGGSISVEQITEMSKRLPLLNEELDEKSMRWLELSEYA